MAETLAAAKRDDRGARLAFGVFIVIEIFMVAIALMDLGRLSALSGIADTLGTVAELEAARSAGWSLVAAFGQLLVATVGFWFIARTLKANEKAVAVAARAITVQEKAAADQSRAYVHAAAAEIEWNATARTCRIQFAFANTGQTPATYFEFGADFVEVPFRWKARDFGISVPARFTRWSPVGSGDRVTAAWYSEGLGERLAGYVRPDEAGTQSGVILITGLVRYGTIYGETFETDFAFYLGRAPDPQGKSTKLSRSTNAFRAYQRVDKFPERKSDDDDAL